MEIIQNNYNKKTTCGHCHSIFTYNENEIEDAYMADEMREVQEAGWSRHIQRNPEWGNGELCDFIGKIVRCPLCGTIMVVKHPHLYLKK